MFEKQVAYFSSDYHVMAWDVPLHGLSRPYRNFSYKAAALELRRILEVEKITKTVLVGMSMGGYVSQVFGDMFPDKVEGFVALATTPFGPNDYTKADVWWLKQVGPMARWLPDGVLRKSIAKSISKTDDAYKKMMEILQPLTKAEIIQQLEIGYGAFRKENRDLVLSFPVLILVGEYDKTGKVKAYCEAWSERTGYSLHRIKGAGHFSNADNPDQVNAEIKAFIEGL